MSAEINVSPSHGLNINAGVLLRIATTANQRANEDHSERAPNAGNDALVAIIFSAFALEAFINELLGLARHFAAERSQTDALSNFISLVSEAEDSRGSIKLKYNLANNKRNYFVVLFSNNYYCAFDLYIHTRKQKTS